VHEALLAEISQVQSAIGQMAGNPEIGTTIKECYAESDSSIWPPACGGSLNLRRRVLTN